MDLSLDLAAHKQFWSFVKKYSTFLMTMSSNGTFREWLLHGLTGISHSHRQTGLPIPLVPQGLPAAVTLPPPSHSGQDLGVILDFSFSHALHNPLARLVVFTSTPCPALTFRHRGCSGDTGVAVCLPLGRLPAPCVGSGSRLLGAAQYLAQGMISRHCVLAGRRVGSGGGEAGEVSGTDHEGLSVAGRGTDKELW